MSMLKLKVLVAAISGIILGFVFAVASIRLELQVDYDSGAEKSLLKIGLVTLREDVPRTGGFGELIMSNGRRGLTGNHRWHTAAVFWRGSKRSPSYVAGDVLKAVRRLEMLFAEVQAEKAREVKEEFLRSLARGGVQAAERYFRETEPLLLKMIEASSKANKFSEITTAHSKTAHRVTYTNEAHEAVGVKR